MGDSGFSPSTTRHGVQLFDSNRSFARAVGEFVAAGLHGGETALVVITPQRWMALEPELAARGHPGSPNLIRRDAEEPLHMFLRDGRPDGRLFDASVGTLVAAEHFGNPASSPHLRAITRVHTHYGIDAEDLLGTFLIDSVAEEERVEPQYSRNIR